MLRSCKKWSSISRHGALALVFSACGAPTGSLQPLSTLLDLEAPAAPGRHLASAAAQPHRACPELARRFAQHRDDLQASQGWEELMQTPAYQRFAVLADDPALSGCRQLAGGASGTPTNPTPPNEQGFSTAPEGEKQGDAYGTPTNPNPPHEEGFTTAPEGEKQGDAYGTPTNPNPPHEEGFSTAPEGEKQGDAYGTPTNPNPPHEEGFSTAPEGEKQGDAYGTPTNPNPPHEEGFSTEPSDLVSRGRPQGCGALHRAYRQLAATPAMQALRSQGDFHRLRQVAKQQRAARCVD